MSEMPVDSTAPETQKKAMWPSAALILSIVFAPAAMAWAIGMVVH